MTSFYIALITINFLLNPQGGLLFSSALYRGLLKRGALVREGLKREITVLLVASSYLCSIWVNLASKCF